MAGPSHGKGEGQKGDRSLSERAAETQRPPHLGECVRSKGGDRETHRRFGRGGAPGGGESKVAAGPAQGFDGLHRR